MLPPKELNTTCLRCGVGLAVEQRYCAACGADRELELAVAGQLHPALWTLQKWLGALGVIEVVSSLVGYVYLRLGAAAGDVSTIVMPGLVQAGWLLLLCLVARYLPLVASVVALALFAGRLGSEVLAHPFDVLSPGPFLLLRILFLFVLVGAVHAGWRARNLRLRAFDAFPSAVASFRRAP